MSLNRYAYVQGNVVNTTDPSGMEACTFPCLTPFFVYNRAAAAAYASYYSRRNFNNGAGQPPAGRLNGGYFDYTKVLQHVSGQSTGSAIFISEALWAGGLPMTINNGSSDCKTTSARGYQYGWRVCPENQSATDNWKNHAALRQYIDDLSHTPPITLQFSNTLARAFVREGGKVTNPSVWYNAINSGLPGILTGDYIYIDSGGGGDNHGFLIVGWGPAIDCKAANDAETKGAPTPISVARTPNTVPYVADFDYSTTGWLQDPRPRPFYCSWAIVAPYNKFFDHAWQFHHVPDFVYIPCERQYLNCPSYLPTLFRNALSILGSLLR